jgi:hypothetical protein
LRRLDRQPPLLSACSARAILPQGTGRGDNIVRLGALVGAAVALGILASPLAAQPVLPDQLAQSTTPQADQPAPPPFPPMPRAKPSHRWTTGAPHRSVSPRHRTTHASHRTTHASHHRATRSHHARARATHHLSRAERDLRYCHQLTARHQARNSRCRVLLRDERRAAEHARHLKAAHAAKTLRFCHRLTNRQLRHNSRCQSLLRDERRAAGHRKARHAHRHHRR